MIVTEEEAKEMVCCGGDGCGQLVSASPTGYRRDCIASACMAWRWFAENIYEPLDPPRDGANFSVRTEISTTRGYCGKAGKP